MDIRNHQKLKQEAAEALSRGRDPKKVILTYSGVMTLVMLLVAVADVWLAQEISGTGGLGNIGTRSILSTIQMVLPLAQTFFLLFWDYGYVSAVLRLSRRQYADHTDLFSGFHRVGPILRCQLVQGIIYGAMLFICAYGSFFIFILTPLGETTRSLMVSMLMADPAQMETMMMDTDFIMQLSDSITPSIPITLALFGAMALPFSYLYRMTGFALMDQPGKGALASMRSSRRMLRGHKIQLFKLDLSFWWYYGLILLGTALAYGSEILAFVGITLPIPETASYLIFYGLYLAIQFVTYYFFHNQVDTTFARVYDTLRPQEPDSGFILGNIFKM